MCLWVVNNLCSLNFVKYFWEYSEIEIGQEHLVLIYLCCVDMQLQQNRPAKVYLWKSKMQGKSLEREFIDLFVEMYWHV